MTRIDSGAALGNWLQAEVTGARAARAKPVASDAAPRQVRRDVATAALQRIRSIPRDDPDRPRKALRVYLETTLLQAFGPHLALEAGFTQLLDAVQERMAADPQIAAVAERAAALLCERAPA